MERKEQFEMLVIPLNLNVLHVPVKGQNNFTLHFKIFNFSFIMRCNITEKSERLKMKT